MPPSLELTQLEQHTLLRTKSDAPLTLQTKALARPQPRDVQVWELNLDQPPPDALQWLDMAERTRAQRFVHALHRNRYIAAHAWLRRILGDCLERAPQDLQFVLGPYGKPELAASEQTCAGAAALRFNLSHSNNIALLAVSTGMDIGVDIEAIRPGLPDATLAAGVLTAAELAELERLPAGQRTPVFFACWTRKEACMKALGLGLALEPKRLHVGMATQRQQVHHQPGKTQLDLAPLHCRDGYAAALAAVDGFGRVTMHTIDELSPGG
ncbi:MAG: 4'-phosphopantetheinyl transferase superfamily protein [Thiomonas sp.]|nr:4'-phosphopantetheinyl transferase superfamily protein [Thiomonas sp.]